MQAKITLPPVIGSGDIRPPTIEEARRLPPLEATAHLYYWARISSPELIRALVEAGADVNYYCRERGKSVLINTISYGELDSLRHYPIVTYDEKKVDRVRLLLHLGADVRRRSDTGGTPLEAAAYYGCPKMVHLLVKSGVGVDDPDYHGNTPLMVAAMCDHVEATLALLRLGASRQARNASGLTAYMIARRFKSHRAAMLLRDRPSDAESDR